MINDVEIFFGQSFYEVEVWIGEVADVSADEYDSPIDW